MTVSPTHVATCDQDDPEAIRDENRTGLEFYDEVEELGEIQKVNSSVVKRLKVEAIS
jgi:hypothetical protein